MERTLEHNFPRVKGGGARTVIVEKHRTRRPRLRPLAGGGKAQGGKRHKAVAERNPRSDHREGVRGRDVLFPRARREPIKKVRPIFSPGECGGRGVGGGFEGWPMRRPAAWGHRGWGRGPVHSVPLQQGRADKKGLTYLPSLPWLMSAQSIAYRRSVPRRGDKRYSEQAQTRAGWGSIEGGAGGMSPRKILAGDHRLQGRGGRGPLRTCGRRSPATYLPFKGVRPWSLPRGGL